MRLKTYSFVCCLVIILVLSAQGKNGYSQSTSFEIIEQDARSVTYELSIDWKKPFKASLDSAEVSTLVPGAMHAAVGSRLELSEQVALPTLDIPQIEVIQSRYDEVQLVADADYAMLVEELSQPPASVHGLGTYRKQASISLVARLLHYDAASQVLRRYRALRIRLTYASAGSFVSNGIPGIATTPSKNGHLAVENSVLADGTILKVAITREGMYRIDRAFLSDAGLDPDTIDPDNVLILGNGGTALPAANSAERPVDLMQNPAFAVGGGDGVFSDNDAVIFYGKAPNGWTYDEEVERWTHYVNPFSNENYYFIKIAAEEGVRVGESSFPSFSNPQRFDQVEGRLFVDFDEFNWSKQNGSGLTWVSKPINAVGRLDILVDSLPGGFAGGEVQYRARTAIRSNPAALAYFNSPTGQIGSARAGSVGSDETDPSARISEIGFTDEVPQGQGLSLNMTLQQRANSPLAALDWLRATYQKQLIAQSGILRFSTPAETSGELEFLLSGFVNTPQVWDVTEPGQIRNLGVSSSGDGYLVRIEVAPGQSPREIIAFIEGAAARLDGAQALRINPQNLHAVQEFPDFVIIAPEPFLPYAEELAAMRRNEGLSVVVTDIAKIYNEFSGGLVDMRATRDYLRFLYDRAPTDELRLKYVLFYGDGHFNYRELGEDGVTLVNWIPPYETVDSFVPDDTFTSDDYFGLLDEEEGEWEYRNFGSPSPIGPLPTYQVDRLDIGIGRFTVQTEEEARHVLDKVKRYENPETFGSWRTRYTFIADDDLTGLSGSTNEGDLHLQNADVVAEFVKEDFPQINLKKIYASSFQREFRNGFKIPTAREEIISALEEGSLLVNYSGHGGEEGLAQEGIFTAEDAKNLSNLDRLAIFLTATCSFGWWDLDSYQSGAEELLLNPEGGAVALLTTVRLVYTSERDWELNLGLNLQLARDMFEATETGEFYRLGDILRRTKNTRVGLQGNNRKFNLLGDPTLRVGIPNATRRMEVESINGVNLDEQNGQLRALDRVSMQGRVIRQDGTLDDTFSGIAELTIFDAERQVPIENPRFINPPFYTVREDLIWRGDVQVEQGVFEANFVVPKDISYSNLPGRMSMYAYSKDEHIVGFSESFNVGGTADNPPNDALGPEISLFLNDTTFVAGGMTSPDPRLIVKLFDESGINTVGAGVGHELLLTINDNAEEAVDVGSNFRSEANSFQRGTVEWDLSDLPTGDNALSVRAWDVLNNSTTATLDFFVAEDEDLLLRNVYNYPNPTSGQTRFAFEHNQPIGTSANIEIRIYTLAGRLIRSIEVDEPLPGGVLQIPWDGRDEDADMLATGVYLYKLRVEVDRPDSGRQISEKIEKLAIIR